MSTPKNSFQTLPWPQKMPIKAPQVKRDHKIKSNSKVTIEENIENKSCSTTWVDPKIVFESYPDPKNSLIWLQKLKKNNLQLSQDKK